MWKLTLIVAKDTVEVFEDALMGFDGGGNPPTVSSFEIDEDGLSWTVEAFFESAPDGDAVMKLVGDTAAIHGRPVPPAELGPIEQKDWVRESQKLLAPINAGRFYVYGSHDADSLPADKVGLHVDAGQAFGSGSHETTRGCLLLLDELGDQINPARVLDLGCGSGILGIGAAKIWPECLVVGSDIDPIATATALENAVINGLNVVPATARGQGFAGLACPGFAAPELAALAPFDVIIANILMEPLLDLAADIAGGVKAGGLVILSGLLDVQETRILEAYARHGLRLKKRVPLKQWHTLLLEK